MHHMVHNNGNELSNAIRFLSLDAITTAASGHPGIACGIADIVTCLYENHIKFNPNDPKWAGRDYFILSAGHGSAALYSLLHLTGYNDVTIEDLKTFRQVNSKAQGHPEYSTFAGIETTTGPLGQGIATAVGIALAHKILASRYGNDLFNNKIYCIVGDGCMMEGVTQEALSFAAHNKLNNLIVIFDDNEISIDGKTSLATSDNHFELMKVKGFECYKIDGHSHEEINNAFQKSQSSQKPVFVNAKTQIGFGTGKAGTAIIHGSPLTKDELLAMKEKLQWQSTIPFDIPAQILTEWRNFWTRNSEYYNKWQENLSNHQEKANIEAITHKRYFNDNKITELFHKMEDIKNKILLSKSESTRKSSGKILEVLIENTNNVIGGSGDLGHSVMTQNNACKPYNLDNQSGNYIHYGIREHAMGAIMNGLSLSGFLPYGGTFLVFSDYMKHAIRLSCIMNLKIWYILSHDSILLGEDGPTHQPSEQLVALRSMPNLYVYRPCNIFELMECYKHMILLDKPSALILTRQDVPTNHLLEIQNRGGYIAFQSDESKNIDIIIIATGSEVHTAIEVAKNLNQHNINARVVSLYCIEIFEEQDEEYKQDLLLINKKVKRIGIELGSELSLRKYIGYNGLFFGMNRKFGMSGKPNDILKHFNLDANSITNEILKTYDRN